jgi:hypothetical protein
MWLRTEAACACSSALTLEAGYAAHFGPPSSVLLYMRLDSSLFCWSDVKREGIGRFSRDMRAVALDPCM